MSIGGRTTVRLGLVPLLVVTVLAAVLTGVATVVGAATGQVLMVAATSGASGDDATVAGYLTSAGFSVEVVADENVTLADADGKDVVFISPTASPSLVGALFASSSVPVVNSEFQLHDDLGLTSSGSANRGEQGTFKSIDVVDGGHPIAQAAGVSGQTEVFTKFTKITWGKPAAGADIIATQLTDASRAAVFVYEAGVTLSSGVPAPARRAGVFLAGASDGLLNASGEALLVAVLEWAAGPVGPPVNVAPVVDAGVDVSGTALSVGLSGSFSDDGLPEGSSVSVLWSGPAGVSFDDATSLTPVVSLPGVGSFELTMSAFDGELTGVDTVTVTVTDPNAAPTILLVTATGIGTTDDQKVKATLEAAGFIVEVIADEVVSAADAVGKSAVVITSTASPSQVGSTFTDEAVPVVNYEYLLHDDLALTPAGSANRGEQGSFKAIAVVDGAHPIAQAAGVSGDTEVFTKFTKIAWGRPAATADVIATQLNDGDRASLFAYEAGALLSSGEPAPARRVGAFLAGPSDGLLNSTGEALFVAAVQWAAAFTPNQGPVAGGTIDVVTGSAPLAVNVDASASTDDGTIVSWLWDFGDGATASTEVASHSYTVPGTYDVDLTVTDDGGLSSSVTVATVTVTPAPGSGWADNTRRFRIPLTVSAGSADRIDRPAVADVDFGRALAAFAQTAAFDPTSLHLVRTDGVGGILATGVAVQFEPDGGDPDTGTLVIDVAGTLPAGQLAHFDAYFDVDGGPWSPVAFTPDLTTDLNGTDEGVATVDVTTAVATYRFDTAGGGFTSIEDSNGNDWIGWSTAARGAGDFRGLPNLIHPEDLFHPGRTGVTTTVTTVGPLRVVLDVTAPGGWAGRWIIYPTFAEFELTAIGHDYWFLYEGTPGGTFEPTVDFYVRSDGSTTSGDVTLATDIPGPEWSMVVDPNVGRGFFASHDGDDTAGDLYAPFEGDMAIMAFGRPTLAPTKLLDAVPARFTVGLVDATTAAGASPTVLSTRDPFGAVGGFVEGRDGPPIDLQPPMFVTGTASFSDGTIIDSLVDEAHGVVGADFDGDGDTDVAAADFVDDEVALFTQGPGGVFTRSVIDGNLDGAYPLQVADLDDDGDIDLLATGYDADLVVWYDNDGTASFTRRTVDASVDGPHSIEAVDLDDDGDQDLLTTNQDADSVMWYENDGSENWTPHTIDALADGAKWAKPVDIDNDADLDVVAASFFDDTIAWYENDGSENFTKRVIDTAADGAYYVDVADFDGDGNADVLAAIRLDDTVAWYEGDGTGGFTKQVIETAADQVRTTIASDLDGDGDPDIAAASRDDDTVSWYVNDGSGGFTRRTISETVDGAYFVYAVDTDNDADLDLLSSARDGFDIAIHTNTRSHLAGLGEGQTLPIGTSRLSTADIDTPTTSLTYTITQAPTLGSIRRGAAPLGVGGTFTEADIVAGLIDYANTTAGVDTMAFTVEDGGVGGWTPLEGTFQFNVAGDGLITQLPFDEASGTVAQDAGTRNNDGTLLNGAAFDPTSGDGSASSVRLDGVDDRVALGTVDVAGTGLTLAAWFNADVFTGSGDPRLISKSSGLQADDHIFMLSTVNVGGETRLRARVRIGGTTTTLIASSGAVTTGTWYHAAATYDGAVFRVYLDGVQVGSTPLSGLVDTDPTMPVSIGSQGGGTERFWDGRIDDVRILQDALTAAEVADLAQ